jgi:hypothetical protein
MIKTAYRLMSRLAPSPDGCSLPQEPVSFHQKTYGTGRDAMTESRARQRTSGGILSEED